MFFSLPCVTTGIWALPEMVIDQETGFTVQPEDVEGLADRLLRILTNPALGRRLGEAGRRRAEQYFTWTATASKIHEEIQRTIAVV
jgi:glycosyltransferase involved in cell wall biosynthesis